MTLGYAWEGHEPDATIEVPDNVARRLLHEGKARRADDEVAAELEAAEQADPVVEAVETPGPAEFLGEMKTAELRALADDHGIEISDDVATRRDLIATIADGLVAEARAATTALEDMTVRDLQAYATAHELVIPPDVRKRADLVAFITEHETREPNPEDPPADGDQNEEA